MQVAAKRLELNAVNYRAGWARERVLAAMEISWNGLDSASRSWVWQVASSHDVPAARVNRPTALRDASKDFGGVGLRVCHRLVR